ncbi:MAG: tetratricopeptide repeat protein [Anaerolineaceae bacterium]|nr:tetratricopeptide repeat protein [Anaerolineaceae bacterium]
MYINERKNLFRSPKRASNPYRVMLLILAIVGVFAVIRAYSQGEIWPPFIPTPTPTRTFNSYMIEGNTHFQSGDLEKAAASYNQAARLEPDRVEIYIQLARVQTYSYLSRNSDQEQLERMNEALATINKAKEIAPNNSDVLAMRAFVLRWRSYLALLPENEQKSNLSEAESEGLLAINLDSKNTLAKAIYAEILIDQTKFDAASQYINEALKEGPQIMDVQRVAGYFHEMMAEYMRAIDYYRKASEINPNLSFLYLRIGALYRNELQWDEALEYFEKAVRLNEQLGLKDPIPYMSIANTYLRMPESSPMIAARNAYKALAMNPYNQTSYGLIGIIYQKARNYEGAEMVLRCAVAGCNEQQTCDALEESPCESKIVFKDPLPLTDNTMAYYFIYGSVLSGLHRPGDDRCERAMAVFGQLHEKYDGLDDEGAKLALSIARAGEAICKSDNTPMDYSLTATPTPASSPTPQIVYPTGTPIIILTPEAP